MVLQVILYVKYSLHALAFCHFKILSEHLVDFISITYRIQVYQFIWLRIL